MSTQTYSPGLEGVIAGETRISFVNPEYNSLMYGGYDIRDLSENSSYEEVAYLLLNGELPNTQQFKAFDADLKKARRLPDAVNTLVKSFPANANGMDTLRTAASLLALYDPDVADLSHDASIRKATRLIGQFPTVIAAAFRNAEGKPIIEPDLELGHAANFLYMLTGEKPTERAARIFDITLIAYADHGFNASTFTARVSTSTLTDLHSGVVGAIGCLKGSLHGGANEEAMKMLMEIGSADKAEAYILDALVQRKKIMGFGHRAYKTGDPRAIMLFDMGEALCKEKGQSHWHEMASIVVETMKREKNILPNVDFPTAYIYYVMGLPIKIYTPIFALARVAGWAAHIVEQQDNNRLIRPKALYEGHKHRDFTPIAERSA